MDRIKGFSEEELLKLQKGVLFFSFLFLLPILSWIETSFWWHSLEKAPATLQSSNNNFIFSSSWFPKGNLKASN